MKFRQHVVSLAWWMPLGFIGMWISDSYIMGLLVGAVLVTIDKFYAKLIAPKED